MRDLPVKANKEKERPTAYSTPAEIRAMNERTAENERIEKERLEQHFRDMFKKTD